MWLGVSCGGSVKIKIKESETWTFHMLALATATRGRGKQVLEFYSGALLQWMREIIAQPEEERDGSCEIVGDHCISMHSRRAIHGLPHPSGHAATQCKLMK